MPDWSKFWDVVTPMGVAIVLGGVLGLERELRGRWAGLRTHMLVAMGAAMILVAGRTAAAEAGGPADISRVIQGIATGVGFIGGGTILKLTEKMEVKGLTTAASIWLSAAVGIAAGVEAYLVAVVGVAIAMPVLTALGIFERQMEVNQPRDRQQQAP